MVPEDGPRALSTRSSFSALSMLSWTQPSSVVPSASLVSSSASSTSSPSFPEDAPDTVGLYPWREEGERILRGYDFSAMLLLVRFWPYSDKTMLREVLLGRRISVLNTLLLLNRAADRTLVAELSNDEKLDRLKWPSVPSQGETPFAPRQTVDETPDRLAAIIAHQTWRRFRRIPFEELVQYALGHPAPSVESFLQYHEDVLPQVVFLYLQMYPSDVERYNLAMEVSHRRQSLQSSANCQTLGKENPFAGGAVSRGVRPHLTGPDEREPRRRVATWVDDPTARTESSDMLEFMLAPLREVLQEPVALELKLTRLAVLAMRFQLTYSDETQTDWGQDFCTDTRFFAGFMHGSPQELADAVTDSDVTNFGELTHQN
ncbi:MAG: hypothetical protein M4579_007008, partial [Chaenotheca gracillima]